MITPKFTQTRRPSSIEARRLPVPLHAKMHGIVIR